MKIKSEIWRKLWGKQKSTIKRKWEILKRIKWSSSKLLPESSMKDKHLKDNYSKLKVSWNTKFRNLKKPRTLFLNFMKNTHGKLVRLWLIPAWRGGLWRIFHLFRLWRKYLKEVQENTYKDKAVCLNKKIWVVGYT